MTSDGSNEGAAWPMPKFRFEVDLGSELKGIPFQDVSGMDVENQIIEYRKGKSPRFSTEKIPGIAKYGNVTLKRGIFVNDDTFWDWHQEIAMNKVKRDTVLIKLLDENGDTTMQWELTNAWPTKMTSTDIKSGGNEVAVDTLEIAYEKLSITEG